MIRQRTIREKVNCAGVGLHSGNIIKLELLPAPENSGITFVRTDRGPHAELKAHIDCVTDTMLATTLSAGVNGSRVSVATVEHLLSAAAGLGVDNLRVLVSGAEVPILDGSAGPFVDMLLAAGIEEQRAPKRFLVIKREVKVDEGDKLAKLSPGPGLHITCSLDFDHPLIPSTPYKFDFSESAFRRELMRARTFGFLRDVEALRARGLALGGSLDNAVVIDHYRVLNPEGLRYPDEFVRHKVVDAIGDLSLFGMPVIGKLQLKRTGHALNTKLVRAVLADARNYEIVSPATRPTSTVATEDDPFAVFDPIEGLAT